MRTCRRSSTLVCMRQPLNNRRELKARRRELRGSLTIAEARLWSCLQHGRLGWKFRRQHSIGPFVVDFYCPSARLAIELDGIAHDSESAWWYDHRRSEYLRGKGVRVIRFVNNDVIWNLEGVLHVIRTELSAVAREPCVEREENHTTPPACAAPLLMSGGEAKAAHLPSRTPPILSWRGWTRESRGRGGIRSVKRAELKTTPPRPHARHPSS